MSVVIGRLTEGLDDAEIVALLTANVEAFVTADLNHRLVPFAHRLASIDYTDHPYAALPAGVAICAVDRVRGRTVVREARESFKAAGDRQGWGYGCFLEGLADLGEGRLDSSAAWWAKAIELLGDDGPVSAFTQAHLALSAYQQGDLRHAVRLAERALFAAERRHDTRVEGIASVYLAFFEYWIGAFSRCEAAIARARRAVSNIADPVNRYEGPLVDTLDGAMRAIRGDFEAAEQCFDDALADAHLMRNEWYRAITLVTRALMTADHDPLRAVTDAQAALRYFDEIGERWWVTWATNSLAVAHLAAGEHHAGLAACAELLANADLNPLERGRALCTKAELHEHAGERGEATATINEAIASLDESGAQYWTARAEVIAAALEPSKTEFLLRSARGRAGSSALDPLWRTLLRGRGQLRIELLGAAHVTIDGRRVQFKTQAELETLTMLTIAGDTGISIDELGERLWPDGEWNKVSHRVDNLASSLRKSLLPTTRLTRANRHFHLDISADECDYVTAMETVRRLLSLDTPCDHDRHEGGIVLNALEQQLLGGPVARWLNIEQARINREAEKLALHLRPKQ